MMMVLYISMKEGIDTGFDSNGRFFVNFSKEILDDILGDRGYYAQRCFYLDKCYSTAG